MATLSNTARALIGHVENIEAIEEVIAQQKEELKEAYAAAKSEGFKTTTLKAAIAARKDIDAYTEKHQKIGEYLDAIAEAEAEE